MRQAAARFAALAILFGLGALIWQALFMPAWSAASLERQQMQRYLERTARQHVIEARSTEYGEWLKKNPESAILGKVYVAASVNSAETLLQSDITAKAQRAGIAINSIESVPSKKVSSLTLLTLRVNLNANTDQLGALLEEIKSNGRNITIAKAAIKVRRPEDQRGPADLSVNLEIQAYARI